MSSEKGLAEVRRGITPKSIVLGGIIFIFCIVLLAYGLRRVPPNDQLHWAWRLVYLSSRWDTGILGVNTLFIPLFIIIMLIQLLPRISKYVRLTPQEWTVVFSILAMVWPMIFWVGIFTWAAGLPLIPAKFEGWDRILQYVPDSWVVKDMDIAAIYYSTRDYTIGAFGLPVLNVAHAEAWVTPVIIWSIFGVLIGLLTYGLALIFRRVFIDIEKLPFPCVYPNVYVVNMVSSAAEEKSASRFRAALLSRKGLYFWIGFIVAFLLEFFRSDGVAGAYMFKELPVKFTLDIDYSGLFPPGGAYIPLMWWNNIFALGLNFLFPLDILFTGLLLYGIWHVIVPWSLVASGVWPAGSYGFGDCWPAAWGATWDKAYEMQFMTMWVGIALFTLWQTRTYWLESFRGFLKGGKAETLEGEPCSYRTSWTIFLIGFVGLLVWMIGSGIHPWMSLAVVIYITLVQVAILRMRGEVWSTIPAVPWGFRTQHTVAPFVRLVGAMGGLMTLDEAANSVHAFGAAYVLTTPMAGGSYQPWGPNVAAIHSYKMAAETKTSPREVFLVQLPSLIIGVILVTVIGWLNVGTGGIGNWQAGWTTGWDGCRNNMGQAVWATEGTGFTARPLSIPTITWGVFGIAITIILMWLRGRLPWFPINVVGVPLIVWTQVFGIFMVFVAFIWKLLTLKIGGVKVYEDIMRPIAVGFILGGLVPWLIACPIILHFSVQGILPI